MKEEIALSYATLRAACPEGRLITLLHIGAQQTMIAHGTGPVPEAAYALAIGSDKTAVDHFRHTPPTPAELEHAIMVVEDELFRVRALAQSVSPLFSSDPALRQIAMLAGVAAGAEVTLSREAVESLFDRLSALVLGRPASNAGIPDHASFAATLLILREFMHHLQFDSIRILASAGP